MMLFLILLLFIALLAMGVPIAYVTGITALVGILAGGEHQLSSLAIAPQKFFAGLDLFTYLAMPFFILAGEIMNRAGITERLVAFAETLVGRFRGGLAHTTMLSSVLFSGMTGAAVSEAAALGNTMVPAMTKQGYKRPFACAVTAAGSIIGPTIPPSNLMVIYGAMMSTSIAGLFAAGILPGLMICVFTMAYIAFSAKRLDLPKSEEKPTVKQISESLFRSLPALMLPAIILGSILGGIMTPTEAAATAIAYALLVGKFLYNSITAKDLFEMLIKTARVTGVVFLIIAAANILGWWLIYIQFTSHLSEMLLAISSNPQVIVGVILLLLLAVGMFMDINAALILLAPVLAPVATAIGLNPVHAGIIIVLTLNISLMTPPVGASLFVLCSITGEKLEKISASLWPFILIQVFVLMLIAFWPQMTLFMPKLLGVLP